MTEVVVSPAGYGSNFEIKLFIHCIQLYKFHSVCRVRVERPSRQCHTNVDGYVVWIPTCLFFHYRGFIKRIPICAKRLSPFKGVPNNTFVFFVRYAKKPIL